MKYKTDTSQLLGFLMTACTLPKKETYLLTIQKQWKNYLQLQIHYCHSFQKNRSKRTGFREQYGEDVPVSSTKNFTEAETTFTLE
jgi:hypothetical protein